MNLRLFSIALLISALPALSNAQSTISFNQGDFVAAEKISKDGETILDVKLSKSGKAKLKKLNQEFLNKEIQTNIAGVPAHFTVKAPIEGDRLEMGPYTSEDAQKVAAEINRSK